MSFGIGDSGKVAVAVIAVSVTASIGIGHLCEPVCSVISIPCGISILVLLQGNAVSCIILCAYAVTVCVRSFCDISIIIIFVRGLISLCIGPAYKS